MEQNIDYRITQLTDLLNSGLTFVSDIKPSDWTEKKVTMKKPFPGKFSYNKTPYAREIINRLSQTDPAHTVSLMKGAQVGMSAGVIIPGIGWIIENNPGNTYLSVGAPDLVKKAMGKVDHILDVAGLRRLIKPQAQRAKNQKTGDTNSEKEFPGGVFSIGSANNHKNLRQEDIQFVFLDDFEAVKKSSKESGDTLSLVKTRQVSYYGKSKLFLISTPEVKSTSNIEPAYLLGDQRKYLIPCPCCGVYIEIKWSHECKKTKKMVGITWQLDEDNKLIPDSVGYRCQECYGFFDDKKKDVLLNEGKWVATSKSSQEGYFSYHISSLYAPIGMADWSYWISEYLIACPPDGDVDDGKLKTFYNVCLGLTYEPKSEKVTSKQLQSNTRDYQIGIVPEQQSIKDGNGRIIMLTCACDLNGTLDDARLDYEVLAWSETGSTYSVTHGSIGTFIPNQSKKQKEEDDRKRWSYEHEKDNNVWVKFKDVLANVWVFDDGVKKMRIFATGVDTGHCEKEAFQFIDKYTAKGAVIFGLKGDKETKYLPEALDTKWWKEGQARRNLYMVLGGVIKDMLRKQMKLKWNQHSGEMQPAGFCNFPEPSGGLYTYKNFFSHYESEERKIEKNAKGEFSARWEKVSPTAQNHLWDCRIYNMVTADIAVKNMLKEMGIKNGVWSDFVSIALGNHK